MAFAKVDQALSRTCGIGGGDAGAVFDHLAAFAGRGRVAVAAAVDRLLGVGGKRREAGKKQGEGKEHRASFIWKRLPRKP